MTMASQSVRKINTILPHPVEIEHKPDGRIYLSHPKPLPAYPDKITERLEYWAQATPDRVFLAQRTDAGLWREVTYAQALQQVRAIGAWLLSRGLSTERPVMILSGNDIEHALLGLGALYAGIAYAPISPAYATISQDHVKLRHIVNLITPGLVFCNDGTPFAAAIEAVCPPEVDVVVTKNPLNNRSSFLFESLLATKPGHAVEVAHEAVGLDTIAKFLFTSGSTGMPKGVINTHRMICSNQEVLRETMPFLREESPVLIDWLPWNHTFGGNHNFYLVLYNGGSLYIDEGKPTPKAFAETIRNLKDIAPSIFFNVPKGYEQLLPYLEADSDLAERFFSRLRCVLCSGAAIPAYVLDHLNRLAQHYGADSLTLITALGATETAPMSIYCASKDSLAARVGLPGLGVNLKLVPVEGKLEARVKGPNVTPGYWRQPDMTDKAFDDEGYYCLGDALKFIDPKAPEKGLAFDGRLTEDFKLTSGTWVSVGPLRAKMIEHFAPFLRDVIIAGLNRDEITALIWPDLDACRTLLSDHSIPDELVLSDAKVKQEFVFLLSAFNKEHASSSTAVKRIILLDEPPSLEAGEITDKGSLNQRVILARRDNLVNDLYQVPPPEHVLISK